MASMLGVLPGRFTGSVVQVTAAGSALADVGGAVLVESTAGLFLIARPAATARPVAQPRASRVGTPAFAPRVAVR